MKNIFKKLDSRGVAHHALIALVVVLGVAGFGAYRIYSSSAATNLAKYSVPVNEQKGCELAGRVWDGKVTTQEKDGKRKAEAEASCAPDCRAKDAEYVKKDKGRPGYCKGFVIPEIDRAKCLNELHRLYVDNIGCARKANQASVNNANVCQAEFPNYLAENKVDRCTADRIVGKQNNASDDSGKGKSGGKGTSSANSSAEAVKQQERQKAEDQAKAAAAEPKTLIDCELYGRRWDESKKTCRPSCIAGGGVLLVDSVTKIKYCQNSVSKVGETSEAQCAALHRKWLPVGCARRVDQKDKLNAIQCLEGYGYYNADFKSKKRDLSADICEVSKAAAQANEQNDVFPALNSSEQGSAGSNGGGNGNSDNNGNTTFRIVLYTEKDFKGQQLAITKDTPKLPKNWNNKVSSYKITSGRWQLCMDEEFKTDCIRPFASDPDLSSKNKVGNAGQLTAVAEGEKSGLNDNISSLRPATTTKFKDAPDEIVPACLDKSNAITQLTADGKCAKGSKLSCPEGYVVNRSECKLPVIKKDVIVPVDTAFKGKGGERACKLLGREWIAKAGKKQINGGDYGCSMRTCENEKDGAPRLKKGTKDGYYCVSYKFDSAYAVRLGKNDKESKKECADRNRVWIDQVNLCAQYPNRKDKDQKIVKAEQCSKKHTVYYIYKATNKLDACFTPNYFQAAQGVAKSVGGSLTAALRQGPKAYCGTVKGGNYHWTGKKCVIDRKTCWNGNSIPVTSKCPPMPPPPPTYPTDPDDPPYIPPPGEKCDSGYHKEGDSCVKNGSQGGCQGWECNTGGGGGGQPSYYCHGSISSIPCNQIGGGSGGGSGCTLTSPGNYSCGGGGSGGGGCVLVSPGNYDC